MRKYLLLILTNLILVLLQKSFFIEFFPGGTNPNLVIALAYVFVLIDDDSLASLSIFIGSLMLSLLSTGIVGLSLFATVLILQVSIFIRRTIFKSSIVQILFIILSVLIFEVASSLSFSFTFKEVFLAGIYTAAVSYLMSLFVKHLRSRYKSFEYRIKV